LLDSLIVAIVLSLSLPVFAYSAYTVALLFASLSYRAPRAASITRQDLPNVSVLIAVFNETNVIRETLAAVAALDYPADRLQVVLADDSDDETVQIVDDESSKMREKGIDVVVSRRTDRGGFKAGALNLAVRQIDGEYVLLLDADSRVTTDSLIRGLESVIGEDLAFVSFRVGHYNRENNLVTRAFALFQDTIDGLQKMGASRLALPYSLQGGFVLAKSRALAQAGYWREGVLAEDADLSCRLFAAGLKGKYISGAQLLSEDPSSLRVWKRQAARVAQGWAQCLRLNLATIIRSKSMGPLGKLGLLLTLLSPFAGLSWIAVTLVSAIAILAGVLSPQASVFGNPLYLVAVSLPAFVFYAAGVNALGVRKMLSARNLVLLPELSYILPAMFTISALSFVAGLAGRMGTFFRTPKGGDSETRADDQQPGEGHLVLVAEGSVSALSVALSVPMVLQGQILLGLSLAGFGLVTLKSMELSSYLKGGSNGH
jgi:cellulose synthase/poly-beta-1,6-N-acetylglucosamine synthase-like glycosyltransferase